jgi:hypothetical protein
VRTGDELRDMLQELAETKAVLAAKERELAEAEKEKFGRWVGW